MFDMDQELDLLASLGDHSLDAFRLDAQQRSVVDSTDRRLRVLAGAGTGKTTALTARVAHLIMAGTPAERILLLTFTRRAATEMVNRTYLAVSQSPGTRRTGRIVGGTFHSVAHRVLRQHADSLGFPAGFSVIDPSDAADLMDVIRDGVAGRSAAKRRFPRKGLLLDLYSRAVDTQSPLTEVLAKVAPWAASDEPLIGDICRDYVARKRSLGLLDFDDLLLHWRAALMHPRAGEALRGDFDHVLVDEYQDVNALQVDIIRHLVGPAQQLCVVGDDAQSIYSFRASTPRHILDFESDFESAATLALTNNYRSTKPILDLANAIGSEATEGFSTVLMPAAKNEASQRTAVPLLVRCRDEDDQSNRVCDAVLDLREAGLSLKDQAVLVRAAHHSDRLELELTRRGIPFVKYGGLRYLEAAHVKDLLAAFRLADNPRDELAWFRLLQRLPGVGPAASRRVLTCLGVDREGEPTEIFLRWTLAREQLPVDALDDADQLVKSLQRDNDEPLSAHAARVAAAVGALIISNFDDAESRIADLSALVDSTAGVQRLSEAAADVTLEPPTSTAGLAGQPSIDEDWLVISTMHSAKGLEWEAVHLIHAADGFIPSDMALTSDEGLEEERRLVYVALTRAKSDLSIYFPLRYHHQPFSHRDKHSWAQLSRFFTGAAVSRLREVPMELADARSAVIPRISTADSVASGLNMLWG